MNKTALLVPFQDDKASKSGIALPSYARDKHVVINPFFPHANLTFTLERDPQNPAASYGLRALYRWNPCMQLFFTLAFN